MEMYLPIILIVVSNIFYHICSKSTPADLNPFAALTVVYLIGAVVSFIIYLIVSKGGNILSELKNINWTSFALGLAIVGLEAGSIYMYKAGWNISTGQLFYSSILAVCLFLIGVLFYKDQITLTKGIGIIVCLVGVFMINH